MDGLIREVAESRMHPIGTTAFLHHRFVEIHPFTDGNGRVARLLANLYMIAKDYPPVVIRTEDRGKYYKCLRSADAGDPVPFASFIAKSVDNSLTLYLSIFGGVDELVPLKELVRWVPYSQEYLSLLARRDSLDAVKIGGVWHSSRRVGERDLGT